MRLGILGGTFNPPHLGHLVCAQEAHLQLALDRVMLIPTRIPPHKTIDEEPGAEHRLEMCRLAIDGDARFEVSEIEVARPGPSYTVDTLTELRRQTPESEFFLILGADIAAALPRWHEPERVLSLAKLGVADRRGTNRASVEAALQTVGGAERTTFFDMPRIAVSSTMVRARARAGQPIRYLVPDPVVRYIEDRRLYGGSR